MLRCFANKQEEQIKQHCAEIYGTGSCDIIKYIKSIMILKVSSSAEHREQSKRCFTNLGFHFFTLLVMIVQKNVTWHGEMHNRGGNITSDALNLECFSL